MWRSIEYRFNVVIRIAGIIWIEGPQCWIGIRGIEFQPEDHVEVVGFGFHIAVVHPQ